MPFFLANHHYFINVSRFRHQLSAVIREEFLDNCFCFALDFQRLSVRIGARPQIGKGTLIYLPISNNKDFTKDSSKWDARLHHTENTQLTIHVHIPANVAVGIWRLRVSTKQQGSRNIRSFDVKENIYVLFNPWNKGMP